MTPAARPVVLLALGLACCGGDRALSQRQFTDLVREGVEADHPGALISRADDRGFSYTLPDGETGRIVTDEEYAYYLGRPEGLDELVARVASLVGSRESLQAFGEDGARLRRSILPVLKPRSFLGEAEARSGGLPLLYGEHSSGLLVFFVIDQPTSISFLTAGSLAGLGMSREQLTRLALENLSHRTGEDRFVLDRSPDGPIAIGETLDGYDAARMISPVLLTTMDELLQASRLVVAVPRRDLVLVAPAGSSALRERLAARARREFHAGPFAITPDLYLVDRSGVRPLPDSL